jgi:DNA-binding transcriptional LysR family regulator
MLEWSDLRVFLAIAREGTLGSAARQLGQTQPTMGRRLRALEAAVGQTLFQRTGEGFVLTGEGASVLGHAERIEEEVLAFQRQLAGQESQLRGMLRLSSSDWFGTYMLAPVLAEFGCRHPFVCVELLTDARLYSLPRREADMVFRIKPFDEPEVISRRLLHIPYALYALAGSEKPCSGDGSGARSGLSDCCQTRQWRIAATTARSRRLCSYGAGLAVLPRPLGDAIPSIAALDLDEQPPGRDTFVGYHRDLRRLARMRELLSLVIEKLAN